MVPYLHNRVGRLVFGDLGVFKSVRLFRAVADETRLRILNLLVRGELCVCEIEQALDIGQSKASRHLAYLRSAGLVSDHREGPWMYYSMTEPDGTAHRMVLKWLADANGDVPQASADLKTLSELRKRGGVCGRCSADGPNTRRRKAAAARPQRKRRIQTESRSLITS